MSTAGDSEISPGTSPEIVPVSSATKSGAAQSELRDAISSHESAFNSSTAKASSRPCTPLSKERSRHNALKHGVFSKVLLLKDESKTEYNSLLNGLREHCQPEDALEEVLVEKLAALIWRQRRVLAAEGAEIRKSREFLEWDKKLERSIEAEKQARERTKIDVSPLDVDNMFDSRSREGLIWHLENPAILDRCLELLNELHEEVEIQELLSESTKVQCILEKIYGPKEQEHLNPTLYDEFRAWRCTSEVEEDEDEGEEAKGVPPEECKEIVLEKITAEIERLKKYKQETSATEVRRTEVEKLRQVIPDSPALERLMRYETNLERSFDRTLTELERIQRMRKGQMVPPPLKVDVSS